MKLTIIGYWGGYPAKDEATSMYILEKDGFMLVLDVGSGGLAKFQKHKNISDIDAVILSHYHADHIADIGVLQHAILVQAQITGEEKRVPLYGHIEDEEQFNKLNHDYTIAIRYNPMNAINIGPFFIRFLKTKHSVPCYGMRITDGKKTVVYTADSAYQTEWVKFSRDADVLVTDCNFYAGQDASAAGHMTSEEAATIAERANVRELILSHLPHFGEHDQLLLEAQKVYNGKISLAYEGMVWKG